MPQQTMMRILKPFALLAGVVAIRSSVPIVARPGPILCNSRRARFDWSTHSPGSL